MKRICTYTLKTLPPGRTNWAKVIAMSEEEVERRARSDKDNLPATKKQLKQFRRVHEITPADIKKIREKLHVSQGVFAAYFGISVRTLQEWEQGRRHPTGAARVLLMVIDANPRALEKALLKPKYDR
jgi:putative transcriptional regulator